MTQPALKLSPEETVIIAMMRRNTFQEITLQVQDNTITSVNQNLKYRRKKGGGLVAGHVTKPVNVTATVVLSPEETALIIKLREKPYQQICVQIKEGLVEGINQTVKFRKKGATGESL